MLANSTNYIESITQCLNIQYINTNSPPCQKLDGTKRPVWQNYMGPNVQEIRTILSPDISQFVKFAGSDNSQFVDFQGRTFLSSLIFRAGQFSVRTFLS